MTDDEINRKFDVVATHLANLAVSQEKSEARVGRLERVLKLAIRTALRERKEMREKINALIAAQTWNEEKFSALAEAQTRNEGKFSALAEAQAQSEEKFSDLAEAQAHTERKLDALIDIVREGRNGKGGNE